MSIETTWSTEDANLRATAHRMLITLPDDVDQLLVRLRDPQSTSALLVHRSRPLTTDDEGFFGPAGAKVIDHSVEICVRDDFGYMTYFSPEFDYTNTALVGDPASPKAISNQTEFDPGTGVPIETLAKALKEFLATAQRPTCVEWRAI